MPQQLLDNNILKRNFQINIFDSLVNGKSQEIRRFLPFCIESIYTPNHIFFL
jgi:hypothetical protein